MNELIPFLEKTAYTMREWSVKMTTNAGSGHATSALSAVDIMAVLFFNAMRFDPDNYNNPNNDRFILSKGHAAPILYAAWHELGKLTDQDLLSYRDFKSTLEGHPTLRFAYAEAATGSLGIGLSIGLGEALAARQDNRDYQTFVLLGDSEVSEGSVWEATQVGAYYKTNNLIGIIDCNRLGQSTPTMQALEGDEAERFHAMFESFGWQPMVVDGHDIAALIEVFDQARAAQQPVMVIAKTKKGYGIDLMEDKDGFHGKPITKDNQESALAQLKDRFKNAASYAGTYQWTPNLPKAAERVILDLKTITMPIPNYKKGEMLPTRKAFGQALATLGDVSDAVISLDAEVKNSTYADIFEKAHPDRFYQCFVAEQNMVSMGVGFNRRGKIPFISTFGAFMSRAHDQIRMGAIGSAALRLVGSHAGVSIGEDGPSQMALEDLACMRAIPGSVVLYPSDAVASYKLLNCMAQRGDGISYLRTTRMATPILYDNDTEFTIGGSHILRQTDQDRVCIIGAGITVHEALKAHEQLNKEGITVSVIDLYSIKPFDEVTVKKIASSSSKKVITVEDHYHEGGIGEMVAAALSNDDFQITRLAVSHLPRSGTPAELMADQKIDAVSIITHVRRMV